MNGAGCRITAIAAPLLPTSGPARYEAALRCCGTCQACLFYAIATVFQLYNGAEWMLEMRRRKPKPTLLLI